MASELKKLDEAQIKKVFDTFDVNSNGILSLAEIDKAVLELYPQYSKNKRVILRAYKAADISKDGFIEFNEFSRLIDLLYYYDELYKTFQKLDENKDNRISLTEFKKGHKLMGVEVQSQSELKKAFDAIDTSRGGYILFDEFCLYAAKKKMIAQKEIPPQEKVITSKEIPPQDLPPVSAPSTIYNDDATSVTSMSEAKSMIEIVRDDVVIKSLYKLSEDLTNFLKKSEGCDVKIEIGKEPGTEVFHAHSSILRARSTYFDAALSKNLTNKTDDENSTVSYFYTAFSSFMSLSDSTDSDNNVVFKKENISPKIFKIILDYAYGGAVGAAKVSELTSEEFLDLLETCEELGIQGFGEYLQPYFLENHREWIRQNLLSLERFASKREAFNEIRNYCLDQLCQDPDVILKSDDLKSIDKSVLISFLSRDDLIANEIDLWNFIIQWGIAQDQSINKSPVNEWPKEDFNKLKVNVEKLIPLIRFKWITSDLFYQQVRPYKLLFDSDLYEDLMQSYLMTTPTTPTLKSSFNFQQVLPKDLKARDKHANLIINENKGYTSLISSWIDKKPFKLDNQSYVFKLVYRGSSENFSYQSFHDKCETLSSTLTIARLRDTGELVGGYNPEKWKIAGRNANATYPIQSKRTFIFKIDKDKLENSKLSKVNDPFNALRHKKESGPNFCDLIISNQKTPIHYVKHFYDKDLKIEGKLLDDYEIYRVLPKL